MKKLKTLHFSIIITIGTTAVGLSLLLILQTQQNSFDSRGFEITNLNQTYKQGDLVTISVTYNGTKFDCYTPKIEVTNKTNTSQVFAFVDYEQIKNEECPNSWSLSFYPGFANETAQSIPLEKAQSYIASATLGGKTIQKEFTVYLDPDRKFFIDIQVNDLDKPSYVDNVLNFTISVRGYGVLDAGQEPDVQVQDRYSSTIWNSQQYIVLCCVRELTGVSRDIPLSTLGEPLKINSAGTYTILVTYAGKTVQKTFEVLLPETTCNQVSKDNSKINLKKYTWIAVSQIKQPFKERCIDIDKILSNNKILQQAIQGADGCQNGKIQCTIPSGMGTDVTLLDSDLYARNSDQYKQSLSKDDAKLLARELGITLQKEPAYKVLKADDKYYLLFFITTDESTGAEAVMEFEKPIGYDPIKLEKGKSLNYTVYVKTLFTFGKPADVKLYAGIPASDSLVSVTIEPSNLTIPERSQENVTLTISASKNARDGIYNMFLYGKAGEGLIGPYNHMNLPVIQVGDSGWTIRTYESGGYGGMGGKQPPQWLKVDTLTDKQIYDKGETIEIKNFIINDSPNKITLYSEMRLFVNVYNQENQTGAYHYFYGIDALYDGKPITLEPHSKTMLARPFYWDQSDLRDQGAPHKVEPGDYIIDVSFGEYGGAVWNNDVPIEIK